ncbi:ribosome biogenesis GTPase Der [bacterium DOLZORAL124_38_8]|nr:MAG: ribosome biogenesis GTPase Der [bacterium DOLZORAL124_38_8]
MRKEIPTVAIIGRPNVGKSTLFNRFVGERRSIVSDISGTTRDSLIDKVTPNKHTYFLVDTAGLTTSGGDSLEDEIQTQAQVASKHADLVLFLLDAQKELTQDDYQIAEDLRKSGRPVVLVANKLDDSSSAEVWHLMELGLGEPLPISAKNNLGIWELEEALDTALDKLGFEPPRALTEEERAKEEADETIRVAFIGRPNVGKSSLLNALLGNSRAVVSDVAGTTRDTIDSHMFWNEETGEMVEINEQINEANYEGENWKKFQFLDTAGLRKPGKVERDFEFWSVVRTSRAIERADVCCLLIDALDGVTHQDTVILGKAIEAGKGIMVCVNKFDLAQEKSKAKEETDERELAEVKMWDERLDKIREKYLGYLAQKIRFANWAPVLFFSAKTTKGVQQVFPNAAGIFAERKKRISTSEMNRFVPEIFYNHVAPSVGTKMGKIKFASQVATRPPKFVFHVNNKDAFHFTYKRYLENKLREKYGFHGTPIWVDLRDSMEKFKGKKK